MHSSSVSRGATSGFATCTHWSLRCPRDTKIPKQFPLLEDHITNTEQKQRPASGLTVAALAITAGLLALASLHFAPGPVTDLVPFLGRFHPLVVHLPIGFLIALLVLEGLALVRSSIRLHHATYIVTWLAAGSAMLSSVLGVLLSRCGTYTMGHLSLHLWLGTATAILAVWLVVLKTLLGWREPHGFAPLYHATLVLAVIAMSLAGHYGGSLTHGSDYLTDYMPASLRSLLGVKAPDRRTQQPTPDAAVFEAVIRPVLKDKCANCHGADKQEGGLRLDTYAAALLGGKSGSNMVSGSSTSSLLLQRIRRPAGEKEHMPPDGKPQPEADDIALLAWWIDNGAPEKATVRELKPTRQVARILQARWGATYSGGELPLQNWGDVAPIVRRISADIGHAVTPLSDGGAELQLTYLHGGRPLGDVELARLLPLKANMVRLGLGDSSVTDSGMVYIAQMKNLRWIDLHRTAITDAGIARLSSLPHLEHLNLYGTKITDTALTSLREVTTLRKVYLWQTAVTTNALENFRQAFVDEGQLQEWRKQIGELQARVDAMGVEIDTGSSTTMATTAPPTGTANPAAQTAKPFNTLCAYTGKPVDPAITSVYKGMTVGFCCNKCKARFDMNSAAEAAKIPGLVAK